MNPTDMLVVVPSRLGVGEQFTIHVKLRGAIRTILSRSSYQPCTIRTEGPFNRSVERNIQYIDDCLPEWTGQLDVVSDDLEGPRQLSFDGLSQGVFAGDHRPISNFNGFRWSKPGIHFIKLVDPVSGLEGWSNAVSVTSAPPRERIFWGDPHWQTFFSDGIRCPEELFSFARNEAFLDFGGLSDHMEAITDLQWNYFQAVTNAYNEPGRFATLHGQEWTHHDPDRGAPGHRNIYYRGEGGPILRSIDPDCDTLEKLWKKLDAHPEVRALAIPHHSANVVMGVDWSQGWNPKYEKAVEIYSVWGNSERSAEAGNTRPVRALKGEMPGRHVVDALKRGYRLGFVGGGDIHDGRPGDDLHTEQPDLPAFRQNLYPQGFTAVRIDKLDREHVFDAMATRRTYATTRRRIYLDTQVRVDGGQHSIRILAASEDGIREAVLVGNGEDVERSGPGEDSRIIECEFNVRDLPPDGFCYVRILTESGDMAWSSPVWGDGK